MITRYPIVFEAEDTGAVSAFVPGLPVYAAADTAAEAEEAVRELLALYVDDRRARGLAVSAPRTEVKVARVTTSRGVSRVADRWARSPARPSALADEGRRGAPQRAPWRSSCVRCPQPVVRRCLRLPRAKTPGPSVKLPLRRQAWERRPVGSLSSGVRRTTWRNSQGFPEHAHLADLGRPREVTADPIFPGSAADELSFRIASGAEGHRFESCLAGHFPSYQSSPPTRRLVRRSAQREGGSKARTRIGRSRAKAGRTGHLPSCQACPGRAETRRLRRRRPKSERATAGRPSTRGSTASGQARTHGVRACHARQWPSSRGRPRAAAARSDQRS